MGCGILGGVFDLHSSHKGANDAGERVDRENIHTEEAHGPSAKIKRKHPSKTYGSSTRIVTFKRVAKLESAPETRPIKAAAGVPTFPAAGVTATSPVIIPVQNPTTDHFRSSRKSMIIQTMPPTLPAKLVLNTAIAARRLAAKVDPPLREKTILAKGIDVRCQRHALEAQPSNGEQNRSKDDMSDIVWFVKDSLSTVSSSLSDEVAAKLMGE